MSHRPRKAGRSRRSASRATAVPERQRDKRICLGQIGAAHGVRGEVRLRSFTSDPAAITGYGPLEAEDGRVFEIESLRRAKEHFVARLSGIRDRSAAERLANLKLYVPRERLPEPVEADEYYHADLIGLTVVNHAGERLGTVVAIHNFGAGDLIEMRQREGAATQMLAFDAATVPEVDLAGGRMVVIPPEVVETPPPRSPPPLLRGRSTAKRSGGGNLLRRPFFNPLP
jgi:16S rRNA processing protein RimM